MEYIGKEYLKERFVKGNSDKEFIFNVLLFGFCRDDSGFKLFNKFDGKEFDVMDINMLS